MLSSNNELVYGFDAEHAQRLSAYEQAMRERARILRDGPADPSWLAALEETMATTGIALAAARRETVARLDQACAETVGPFPAARLALTGEIEALLERLPALGAEEEFRRRLAELRRQDRESGTTALGPNRSDLGVRHEAMSTKIGGAEGSRSSTVLRFLPERTGESTKWRSTPAIRIRCMFSSSRRRTVYQLGRNSGSG